MPLEYHFPSSPHPPFSRVKYYKTPTNQSKTFHVTTICKQQGRRKKALPVACLVTRNEVVNNFKLLLIVDYWLCNFKQKMSACWVYLTTNFCNPMSALKFILIIFYTLFVLVFRYSDGRGINGGLDCAGIQLINIMCTSMRWLYILYIRIWFFSLHSGRRTFHASSSIKKWNHRFCVWENLLFSACICCFHL